MKPSFILNAAYRTLPKADAALGAFADAELTAFDATDVLLTRLARLAPFGMGNEKPVFAFRDVSLARVSWFGKAEEHLRLSITTDGFDALEGISFYAKRTLGSKVKLLEAGGKVNILASLERDQFTKGRPVRLRLVSVS
jgi:single-stranded-DNA-specific exonuclease